jgi:hypothetical protein
MAGRDSHRLPTIEEIARDSDSVLFDPFVDLIVGYTGKANQRNRDRERSRFGFASREAGSSRDMRHADMTAQEAVSIYLGKNKGHGIELLNPKF